MRTPNKLWEGDPENLQKIAAGETKQVADTFKAPSDFATTPIVTEEQRKTGTISAATEKLRSTAVSGYPGSNNPADGSM